MRIICWCMTLDNTRVYLMFVVQHVHILELTSHCISDLSGSVDGNFIAVKCIFLCMTRAQPGLEAFFSSLFHRVSHITKMIIL